MLAGQAAAPIGNDAPEGVEFLCSGMYRTGIANEDAKQERILRSSSGTPCLC